MNPISLKANAAPPRQILLVDDDLLLHKLLEEYLCQHNYQINALQCGEEISGFLQQQQPDCILLDIMMQGKDGLYWLKWLKENHTHIPVMLLSAKKLMGDRLQGLELGADDYLTKPFHPKELLIRMRNIMRDKPQNNGRVIHKIGNSFFDPVHEHLERGDTTIKLTTQENSLLHFFCQNHGQILTRDAISHAMSGNDHQPMNRSIDMTINRLRKKLDDSATDPRYLCTVWRKGYRLILDP